MFLFRGIYQETQSRLLMAAGHCRTSGETETRGQTKKYGPGPPMQLHYWLLRKNSLVAWHDEINKMEVKAWCDQPNRSCRLRKSEIASPSHALTWQWQENEQSCAASNSERRCTFINTASHTLAITVVLISCLVLCVDVRLWYYFTQFRGCRGSSDPLPWHTSSGLSWIYGDTDPCTSSL